MLEKVRNLGIILVFLALVVILSISSSTFLSTRNAANILEQSAILLIFASTLTVSIIAGIFDLSVAAMATTCAIFTVIAINFAGMVLGLILSLIFGMLLGYLNGIGIVFSKINAFIGTLATSFIFRGLGLIFCHGGLVSLKNRNIGTTLDGFFEGRFLGVKGLAWVAIIFVIIVGILLSKTTWGKYVYAVGGNMQAASLSGIRTKLIMISCFVLSGLGAAIAGIIYVAQYSSGATNAYSDNLNFTAIAAPVVGGVSIFGGEGAIWRGGLGVLTFALISNGLNLLGVDTTYQLTVLGILIFAAVVADQVFRRDRK